ncbi:aldo/keto reductase [Streptomyces sp. NPDC055992]|uniref:aldo/keto reductase n=1 Tax=Streptomyces sp. NPDC055992 TaxID=3345673 RepID=UPI0035E0BF95
MRHLNPAPKGPFVNDTHPPAPGGRTTLPGGKEVSRLGIGCWPIGGPAENLGMPMGWSTARDSRSLDGLARAFELGANLFDTADVYGHGHSERLLGAFLTGVPRHQVAVTSKVGYFSGSNGNAYDPAHMRVQLEKTLTNLGTDHLDVYALHNANFGPEDVYLNMAVETMRTFQAEGLIKAVGMRGPHRYAPERLVPAGTAREDKHARFRRHFAIVRPDILAIRDNLLTPRDATAGIRAFADERNVPVIINKALGQGLLTGKHAPSRAPAYGAGDHRSRKRWFTEPALRILQQHLDALRERFGHEQTDLVHTSLRYLLQRWPAAVVLTGFTSAAQVEQNLSTPSTPLTPEDLAYLAIAGRRAQEALDADGEVFTDESA